MDETVGAPGGSDRQAFPTWLALVIAIVALAVGARLLDQGGKNAIGGGVLLLIGALAFGAVSLAQEPYGPEQEGPLDLSARLGLGLLGGVLGALAAGLVARFVVGVGLAGLLGVSPPEGGPAVGWVIRTWHASLWGAAFGILLPFAPGGNLVSKGLLFSLLPSLYLLLKVLPRELGVGLLGAELGVLAFLFVVAFGLVWGAVCGAVIAWGALTREVPVSRHLG